jgi:hypothetical protein
MRIGVTQAWQLCLAMTAQGTVEKATTVDGGALRSQLRQAAVTAENPAAWTFSVADRAPVACWAMLCVCRGSWGQGDKSSAKCGFQNGTLKNTM